MSALPLVELFNNHLSNMMKGINTVLKADMCHTVTSEDLDRIRNQSGETLLHIVVKYGDVNMTNFLIEIGSNVDAQDDFGNTPIMLAIKNKPCQLVQIIEILCQAMANIYITDLSGTSALDLILDDSTFINDYIHKSFLNVIHHECMYNNQLTAEKLINLGYPLWHAIILGNRDVIEHMILSGCPINHPKKQFMALNIAVRHMNIEIIKVLIKYGADVNLFDNRGRLPIVCYGSYLPDEIQDPEIIDILLNKMALIKNGDPIDTAVSQFKRAFECGTKEIIQMFLEHTNDIWNYRDIQHLTPLHYLVGNYHSDITEVLQGQKIDVNVRDLAGRTPLYEATEYQYSHIKTFQFLLENGADVNAKTHDQVTPLFSVCENCLISKEKYFIIIELFLQYNVDIQFLGLNHKTVFDIILERQTLFMAEPLLEHLAILEEQSTPITEHIRCKINNNEFFMQYFHRCKAELVKMKNYAIVENLTLYLILVNQISEQKILKMCRYSTDALSTLGKLQKKFYPNNCYYSVVQKRISSIMSKLELLQKSSHILCKLLKLGNNPNHIIVAEIIDFLDSQDLQAIINIDI